MGSEENGCEMEEKIVEMKEAEYIQHSHGTGFDGGWSVYLTDYQEYLGNTIQVNGNHSGSTKNLKKSYFKRY